MHSMSVIRKIYLPLLPVTNIRFRCRIFTVRTGQQRINRMNMKKLIVPLAALVCLLLAACDKDEIVRPPMEWTYEILTPGSVEYEGGSVGWAPQYNFRANGLEGDIVMTCTNYDVLNLTQGDSYTYDCGWATVKVEGNRLRIHFPYDCSGATEASETISVSGSNGSQKAVSTVCLTRTFDSEGRPEPPQPDGSGFRLTVAGFRPFMQIDSPLPAPLDLVTFRITDADGKFTPVGFPEFTQHYDSIVWSADGLPNTLRVYESSATEHETEKHLSAQWSSHFFKGGTVRHRLRGYRDGKVEHESTLDLTLYERDFMGLEWGPVVLQNPQNLTAYCLLDTEHEYQLNDIVAKDGHPFSRIIPVNHRLLPEADFPAVASRAITTLMADNVGEGQSAKGKEQLFRCLPEAGVEAVRYWENKTTRMLLLHQRTDDPDEPVRESYYLHVEPKGGY